MLASGLLDAGSHTCNAMRPIYLCISLAQFLEVPLLQQPYSKGGARLFMSHAEDSVPTRVLIG